MSWNVLEAIAGNYDKVKEGVGQFMGGNIIETEATRIYREGERKGERKGKREGRAEGKAEGRAEGKAEGEIRKSEKTAIRLYNMGDGYEKIASALDVDIRQVQRWIRKGRKMNQ